MRTSAPEKYLIRTIFIMTAPHSQDHVSALKQEAAGDTLTVLYDGSCPLCLREIEHVQGLARRSGDKALCFVDVSSHTHGDELSETERVRLLARFHVQKADGTRIDGAAAFVAMWEHLPGWRWLARMARVPGGLALLELAYRGFLHVRPWLQAGARRWHARR